MIDRCNLIDSHQQGIQNWIMVVLGLLKSGKVRPRRTIARGNLIKLLGMKCNKFAPHRGKHLLDGNAQSVRYGEIIHDGSRQPDSANYQEEAESETFVMGSDAAEFLNKVSVGSTDKIARKLTASRAAEPAMTLAVRARIARATTRGAGQRCVRPYPLHSVLRRVQVCTFQQQEQVPRLSQLFHSLSVMCFSPV